MSVPETAVDEYDGSVFWKYDVGLPWQLTVKRAVYSKSVAHLMKHGADYKLRFCILRPDPTHVPATLFFCQVIDHWIDQV